VTQENTILLQFFGRRGVGLVQPRAGHDELDRPTALVLKTLNHSFFVEQPRREEARPARELRCGAKKIDVEGDGSSKQIHRHPGARSRRAGRAKSSPPWQGRWLRRCRSSPGHAVEARPG
jgi:hypothetical protein